jgi:hypothetical protein
MPLGRANDAVPLQVVPVQHSRGARKALWSVLHLVQTTLQIIITAMCSVGSGPFVRHFDHHALACISLSSVGAVHVLLGFLHLNHHSREVNGHLTRLSKLEA